VLPPPPLRSTLFPYTTLFRSGRRAVPEVPRGPELGRPGLVELLRRLPAGLPAGGEAPGRSAGDDHPGERNRRYPDGRPAGTSPRSEEHTSELQSLRHLVCRLL